MRSPRNNMKAIALACGLGAAIWGQPVAAQTEQLDDQFGDWTLRCEGPAADSRECWLVQVMRRADSQRFLAEIRLGLARNEDVAGHVMVMRTPTGILLTARAAFRVDDDRMDTPMNWNNCTERQCVAVQSLDPIQIDRLRRGLRMFIGYQSVREQQPTVFEVSLVGVTDGLAALEARVGDN